jgi:acyl-CoA thioesterase FadM
MNLPSNADFSGPIVTGDLVTVSIQYKSGKNKSRTYNIKTGALVREIDM